MKSEKCLNYKCAKITEYGANGRLGETIIECEMCEENEFECCFCEKD